MWEWKVFKLKHKCQLFRMMMDWSGDWSLISRDGRDVSCSVSQQWCLSLSSVLMLCNLLLAWLMVQQQIFQGRINYKLPIPFTKWVKMEPIGRRKGTLFSCKSYLGFQGFPISKLNIFYVFLQVFQLVQSWREFTSEGKKRQ